MHSAAVLHLLKSIEKRMPQPGRLAGVREAFGRRAAFTEVDRKRMPQPGSLAGVWEAFGSVDAPTGTPNLETTNIATME